MSDLPHYHVNLLTDTKPTEGAIQFALIIKYACTAMGSRLLFRQTGSQPSAQQDAWAEIALQAVRTYNAPHLLWPTTVVLQHDHEQACRWATRVLQEALT